MSVVEGLSSVSISEDSEVYGDNVGFILASSSLAGAVLGFLGSFCVVAMFVGDAVISERIVLYLVTSNFVWSTTSIGLNATLVAHFRQDKTPPVTVIGCDIVGPLNMWGQLATVLWADAIIIYLVATVVFNLKINTKWFFKEWIFIAVCYLLPVFAAFLPFIVSEYYFNGAWCGPPAASRNGEQLFWIAELCITILIISVGVTVVMLFMCLKKEEGRVMYRGKSRSKWRRGAGRAVRRLLPFPVVFILQFSFCIINALLPPDSAQKTPLWFDIMHMIAFQSAPFFFCILYVRMDRVRLARLRGALVGYVNKTALESGGRNKTATTLRVLCCCLFFGKGSQAVPVTSAPLCITTDESYQNVELTYTDKNGVERVWNGNNNRASTSSLEGDYDDDDDAEYDDSEGSYSSDTDSTGSYVPPPVLPVHNQEEDNNL
ncbi:hypothetical protein Pelo_1215 [Pelomyxa schiedti]|nr:hypothetical protein Pelo_1215 [Pelomyxa schiedti]